MVSAILDLIPAVIGPAVENLPLQETKHADSELQTKAQASLYALSKAERKAYVDVKVSGLQSASA